MCGYCGSRDPETVLIHADRNVNYCGDILVTRWCSNCHMADIIYYPNGKRLIQDFGIFNIYPPC